MAEERGTYSYMLNWLKLKGYAPDTRMASFITDYWGWYTATNGWYQYKQRRGWRIFNMQRETLHPAALVAEAWSDLLMNEKLDIKSDGQGMETVLMDHFHSFGVDQADFVTRAFALGTGAWAISLDGISDDGYAHPDAVIKIEAYDAGQIMPLTWSADDCTQCAFATRVEVNGKDYNQCQAHVLVDGTYHILTRLFDIKTNNPVSVEGITEDLDTKSPFKTFAIVKPAVPNVHFSYCAMGASVFDKGISAIKAVDEALTSFLQHLRVARPKVFVSDLMIEKKKTKDANGNNITEFYAFGEAEDIIFRTPVAEEGKDPMKIIQPEMRISEHEEAINAGLKMLSTTCGLGDNYWTWDHATGLKTATEVVSDSSMLARTLRKHQNELSGSIKTLVRGVAGVCRSFCNTAVDPMAEISIDFDDSIITDTQTDKNMALTEISMLGLPFLKRQYLKDYYGLTDEQAIEIVPETVVDTVF